MTPGEQQFWGPYINPVTDDLMLGIRRKQFGIQAKQRGQVAPVQLSRFHCTRAGPAPLTPLRRAIARMLFFNRMPFRRRTTFALLALIAATAGVSLLYASDGSSVARSATQTITAFGSCRKITNASPTGKTVYVPTQSIAEWQSFYASPPSGVSIASCDCAVPWGGAISDGQGVTAYASASVSGTQCTKQTRTCTAGVLSGTYRSQTCSGNFAGAISPGNYCATCALENRNEMRGENRYLLNNDQASIDHRCQELGFTRGVANSTYTSAEWCGTYRNARTKKWNGSSWNWLSCINGNVKQATCY